MDLNINALKEPRGVMRVLQFIFAICAFATTTGFTNEVKIGFHCPEEKAITLSYDYPFTLHEIQTSFTCENSSVTAYLVGNFASDAQFFVCTGVLSMLYCMGILAVYLLLNAIYEGNAFVPMADFCITLVLAVFWLSGSAAWSNGVAGLKAVTDFDAIQSLPYCKGICIQSFTGSFSSLNISLILGYLNFFLWGSDLWFLYKETQWFKGADPTSAGSPGLSAA